MVDDIRDDLSQDGNRGPEFRKRLKPRTNDAQCIQVATGLGNEGGSIGPEIGRAVFSKIQPDAMFLGIDYRPSKVISDQFQNYIGHKEGWAIRKPDRIIDEGRDTKGRRFKPNPLHLSENRKSKKSEQFEEAETSLKVSTHGLKGLLNQFDRMRFWIWSRPRKAWGKEKGRKFKPVAEIEKQ